MNYTRFFIVFLMVPVLAGCTKEEADYRLSGFDIPVVTGFIFRDIEGTPQGNYGEPNVYLHEGEDYLSSDYRLTVFPNPAYNMINVDIISPHPDTQKKLWITPAVFASPNAGISSDIGMSNMILGGTPIIQYENSRQFAIDLSSFAEGYYRVYVEADGLIFYDNLVISKKTQQ